MKRLAGSVVAIAGAAMLVSFAAIPAAGQPSTQLGLPRAAVEGQAPAPAARALPRTADGGALPYQPAALEKRKQNYECYAFALDDLPIVPTK